MGSKKFEQFSWSDEKIEQLKLLIREGFSAGLIARRLGVTRSSISGKASRLGLRIGVSRQCLSKSLATSLRKPNETPLRKRRDTKSNSGPKLEKQPIPQPHAEDIARKTFAQLAANDCKYPVNDPLSSDFGFCALERMPGSPYCRTHHAIAYTKVLPKPRPEPSKLRETTGVMA